MFNIDQEVEKLINDSQPSSELHQIVTKKWEDLVKADINRINKKWASKIKSTTTAFEKDKDSLKEHRQSRFQGIHKVSPRIDNSNDNSSDTLPNKNLNSTPKPVTQNQHSAPSISPPNQPLISTTSPVPCNNIIQQCNSPSEITSKNSILSRNQFYHLRSSISLNDT